MLLEAMPDFMPFLPRSDKKARWSYVPPAAAELGGRQSFAIVEADGEAAPIPVFHMMVAEPRISTLKAAVRHSRDIGRP
jgi:hypothetical protein